jgi:hypothetical protein
MIDFRDVFELRYRPLCDPANRKHLKYQLDRPIWQRGAGFAMIWQRLLDLPRPQYHIVETGVLRRPGNWNDGQSTFLFQEFLRYHGGHVQCVDISVENCEVARGFLDPDIVTVTCDDSLNFLGTVHASSVDLWHLDSYDLKWDDDTASAEHHLMEFMIFEQHIKPGALVMIDDNAWREGQRTGKGRRISEYLDQKGHRPIYDDYQIIYQF